MLDTRKYGSFWKKTTVNTMVLSLWIYPIYLGRRIHISSDARLQNRAWLEVEYSHGFGILLQGGMTNYVYHMSWLCQI